MKFNFTKKTSQYTHNGQRIKNYPHHELIILIFFPFLDALNSPNVQLFVINECTLMSLVELPILTSQSVAGVKTAETQVRIILRDISGKFCWESTALYNSEDSTMSNDDGSIELPEWPPTEAYENGQPKSFSQVQALRYTILLYVTECSKT